jgi:hypothetical protein
MAYPLGECRGYAGCSSAPQPSLQLWIVVTVAAEWVNSPIHSVIGVAEV